MSISGNLPQRVHRKADSDVIPLSRSIWVYRGRTKSSAAPRHGLTSPILSPEVLNSIAMKLKSL